ALDEDRLLSVVLDRPTREERAATVGMRWALRVSGLAALAWLLLALGGAFAPKEATLAGLSLMAGA
ncbi:MAG: hypothetical protein GWO00_05525, partial [Gemmatimonadetes bacterium]|nr:hypothetical protein [Gemmatimonadota bacterium]NIT86392.1 hypothetical protein [Gemmatimonadota bacterium]NIU30226.1 hypothetical protein [Gemmatimonadota bacterium]NIV60621.1 hypothetical protein [Gemmatimonadota bacterium]NIW63295.1 hypothetical protein [Gemmatimonadota bacterium]